MQKCVLLLLLATLASCSVTQPDHPDTILSDQLTDCAYAGTRYLMLARELGATPRISYAQAGFYNAAAEALSSKAHAVARFAHAREQYFKDVESNPAQQSAQARKAAMLQALASNLDKCAQLTAAHSDTIQPKLKEYLQHAK